MSEIENNWSLPSFKFEVVTVYRKGKKIKRERKEAKYFAENLGNGVELEMVYIPGGSFVMGSPEGEGYGGYGAEEPQHEVAVKPFYMGKFQITQAQWREIAKLPKVKIELHANPSSFKGDELPVEQVSWYDAIEFCARLSKKTGKQYRLSSEAEWEYACRAGTKTPFHSGETITGELANYSANSTYADEAKGESRKGTTPVGSFSPNAFGLYDLHGNVWEWCADPWNGSYKGAPEDGRVWDKKNENDNRYQNILESIDLLLKDRRARVLRGGAWGFNPWLCRSAFRVEFDPVYRDDGIGFRVACGVPGTL